MGAVGRYCCESFPYLADDIPTDHRSTKISISWRDFQGFKPLGEFFFVLCIYPDISVDLQIEPHVQTYYETFKINMSVLSVIKSYLGTYR
jgi:hypothetical protein